MQALRSIVYRSREEALCVASFRILADYVCNPKYSVPHYDARSAFYLLFLEGVPPGAVADSIEVTAYGTASRASLLPRTEVFR